LYTILDIESTGGKFNEEGITEIAIYKFDGHEIVDQFASLVNPEIPIQPFVVKLTGINNKMLRSAPKFFEVAKRIIEITEGTTIVAHNASFDYRILKLEFGRLGYDFKRLTLDTVELSKKLIPDMESYSLGKLTKALGIPITDRHRATGDALATVKLFKILLNKDVTKKIISSAVTEEKKTELTPKLVSILRDLPTATGVYYMHKKGGEIIYIGKSKNIQKRVNQHFLNKSSRAKKMQTEIVAVTYEETGSELIALLKESQEIKTNQTKYNKAQRKTVYGFGLYDFVDNKGYVQLKIKKTKPETTPLISFSSIAEGNSILSKLREEFTLCNKLVGLEKTKGACFHYGIEECKGACIGKENPEEYNQRVEQLIHKLTFEHDNFVIVDKGRNATEKSVVLIEDGEYRGFGFADLARQITNIDILKSIITPMKNNREVKSIIQRYLNKKKTYKIIKLDNQN
jgi:DNA polymerase-3 subunit epsilon